MTDVSPWNRLITIDTVIALHKVGIDRTDFCQLFAVLFSEQSLLCRWQ
jgi:hypothetical protein